VRYLCAATFERQRFCGMISAGLQDNFCDIICAICAPEFEFTTNDVEVLIFCKTSRPRPVYHDKLLSFFTASGEMRYACVRLLANEYSNDLSAYRFGLSVPKCCLPSFRLIMPFRINLCVRLVLRWEYVKACVRLTCARGLCSSSRA